MFPLFLFSVKISSLSLVLSLTLLFHKTFTTLGRTDVDPSVSKITLLL